MKNGELVLTGKEGYCLFIDFCDKNRSTEIELLCKECPARNFECGCYYGWLMLDRGDSGLTERESQLIRGFNAKMGDYGNCYGGIIAPLFDLWEAYRPNLHLLDITVWNNLVVFNPKKDANSDTNKTIGEDNSLVDLKDVESELKKQELVREILINQGIDQIGSNWTDQALEGIVDGLFYLADKYQEHCLRRLSEIKTVDRCSMEEYTCMIQKT